jgi:hypothetical protein
VTVSVGQPHVLQCKNPDADFTTLGTAMPGPADAGLNLDDKGQFQEY